MGLGLDTILRSVAYYLVSPLVLAALTRSALRGIGHSVEHVQQRLRMPYLKTATLMAVIATMFASQAEALFANPGVVLVLIPPVVILFGSPSPSRSLLDASCGCAMQGAGEGGRCDG